MIIYATLILGFLVFIHEGGHYMAARAFGVRVSEFMLGLPGPNIGFKHGETKFGVTAVPLGGYARICGMEPGEESPYLQDVLRLVFERGTVNMEDVAQALNISDNEALFALDELVEWGTIKGPHRKDPYNTYRTPAIEGAGEGAPRGVQLKADAGAESFSSEFGLRVARSSSEEGQSSAATSVAPAAALPPTAEGAPRPLDDVRGFFKAERARTYRNLPFWKRCIILLAGPGMNILFTMLAFVIIYSVVGYDIQDTATGEITHIVVSPLRSIQAGFEYIGMVFVAILGLFNPQTAAATVSDSTSLIGIAVLSKSAVEQGIISAITFSAMLSVSLGLMNLLPIPPLDGGRFVIEIYQKLRGKPVSPRVMNSLSLAGVALFMLFFVFMMNQDIQRFIFGNWS